MCGPVWVLSPEVCRVAWSRMVEERFDAGGVQEQKRVGGRTGGSRGLPARVRGGAAK